MKNKAIFGLILCAGLSLVAVQNAAADPLSVGAVCASTPECESGLECIAQNDGRTLCEDPNSSYVAPSQQATGGTNLQTGSPCTSVAQCASGLDCIAQNNGNGPTVCENPNSSTSGGTAALGDPCGVSASYSTCVSGLSCVNSGQADPNNPGGSYFYCASSASASTGAPSSTKAPGSTTTPTGGAAPNGTTTPTGGTAPSALNNSGIVIPTNTGLANPSGGIKAILTNLLTWLLGVVGIIAIIGFVISGIQYIMAAGDEKIIETAKRNMLYSIIGVIVVLASFVIIQAIDYALRAQTF